MQETPTKAPTAAERGVTAWRGVTPYPTSVRIAAIIWIVQGMVFAAIIVVMVARGAIASAASGAAGEVPAPYGTTSMVLWGGCLSLVGVTAGALPFGVGVQTLRARLRDVHWASQGSLAMGTVKFLGLPVDVINAVAERGSTVWDAVGGETISIVAGGSFLLAGGLGMLGRKAYLAHRGEVIDHPINVLKTAAATTEVGELRVDAVRAGATDAKQ